MPSSREDNRPNKKLKRSHSGEADDELLLAPLAKRRDDGVKYDHTPPPTPPPADRASVEMEDADSDDDEGPSKKIDLEGINDEIVEAVVVQLQNTGNRPHLVKELAAILMQQLKIVQQSANPCAIVSSRLSTYLKRSCWSALTPCPLAKELETVHPRRTYFYLTTCPHQPLPDPAHAATLSQLASVHAVTRAIISPSLSSAASNSEDADAELRRRELSPSPEVDLSSPEFDDVDDDIVMPSTPIGSLSIRGGFNFFTGAGLDNHTSTAHGSSRHRHNRATSPPLEKDEKEFTQTADGLQKRKLNGELLSAGASEHTNTNTSMEPDFSGRDDSGLFDDRSLLSPGQCVASVGATALSAMAFMTSPAMRPSVFTLNLGKKDADAESWAKLDGMLEWDRSPENIELEELDGLLSDY